MNATKVNTMDAKQFSATANHMIDSIEGRLRHAIYVVRDGGERLGQAAKQRWDAALEESSAQLSAETLHNAQRAQAFFGDFYSRGIERSTSGADVALDAMANAARAAVQRAHEWRQSRA